MKKIKSLNETECSFTCNRLKNYFKSIYGNNNNKEKNFQNFLKILIQPPLISTIRLNKIYCSLENINDEISSIKKILKNEYKVEKCDVVDDCVMIPVKKNEKKIELLKKCVIVDRRCGSSVIRGSNVFAPGILGIEKYLKLDEKVSIICDLKNNIKFGTIFIDLNEIAKVFENFVHVGTGMIKQTRRKIFTEKKGIAVELVRKECFFQTCSLNMFKENPKYYLQNLPSIIASHVLNPNEKSRVIDMCASPGGKTTHIANLMNNTGIIYAFDRTKNKVTKIKKLSKMLGLTNIQCRKQYAEKAIKSGYEKESFDYIICDVPCSGIGHRPQFQIRETYEELEKLSFYQRKIFNEGFELLKYDGIIVYSTCTLNPLENEENVKYFLNKYKNLKLVTPKEKFLNCEYVIKGIESILGENSSKILKFCPVKSQKTIGFFIAKFVKKKS